MTDSKAHRRELCFWGWGYEDEALSSAEKEHLGHMAGQLGVTGEPLADPKLEEFDLPAPRIAARDKIKDLLSATPYDRITHGYGKSFADLVRMQMRHMPRPPDWVAFPRSEDDLDALRMRDLHEIAHVASEGGQARPLGDVDGVGLREEHDVRPFHSFAGGSEDADAIGTEVRAPEAEVHAQDVAKRAAVPVLRFAKASRRLGRGFIIPGTPGLRFGVRR